MRIICDPPRARRTLSAAEGAKAIVAWGSCASNGCIQASKPNPTGATPIHKIISGKPIINVPGCPPIAEVMAGTIVHLLAFDRIPQLDAGLFVDSFDDENAKRGYCLYKMGCRGPVTYNSCGVIRWNNGVSYPIQSGHGCIGCSEANFWDNGPFYQHLASFPGVGSETTADTVGVALGVGTAVGIAAHAISTNIRKGKLIREEMASSDKPTEKKGGA